MRKRYGQNFCDVLTMSVSTSFFIIKPHPWIMRRRKPLPLPAFPSLLSVHHDPLPWNYYSIDQISTFQTHCWVLALTYWVLFSSFSLLCFSWVLLTHILSMTWLAYLLHATVWQRNFAHKEQGTISHHVMSLLLTCSFLKPENQRDPLL